MNNTPADPLSSSNPTTPVRQSPTQILRSPAPITILGVPFDGVTTAETLALIGDMIASRQPHYLATANVDFLVQALNDPELRRILFDAHLVLCDGTVGRRLNERGTRQTQQGSLDAA